MQGKMIDIGGIATYCIERGVGPPLVLLHGAAIGVDANITWFRTIAALESDYRVIAFDQVGFGHTDPPADGRYRDRLERVDHVIEVLEHLSVRDACIVGHSEGAFIAARIAIVAPHLISRLVIVTSGGTAPYLGGDADNEWMAASAAAYNDPERLSSEDAFIRGNAHLSRRADPQYENILRQNYRWSMKVEQDKLFKTMKTTDTDYLTYGDLQREYVLPFVGALELPILLIWATDDATVPVARGLKLLECMPSAELHVFRDSAHNVMHDQSEKFNHLLRGFCAPMREASVR